VTGLAQLYICVVCQVRAPAYESSMLCGGCYARLRGNLGAVAWAYEWLGDAMASPAAAWKTGTIHRAGGSKLPFQAAYHDARVHIQAVLVDWARRIGEEHRPGPAGSRQSRPADQDVRTLSRWISARLQWASEQPWCDQLDRDLHDLRATAHGLVPWTRGRRDLPLPCPGCALLSLSLYAGDDGIACRNRACGHTITWADYEEKVIDMQVKEIVRIEIAKLQVRPGDVVLVRMPTDGWDHEAANWLYESMKSALPNNEVRVVTDDVEISVLQRKEATGA
jgi:hypothetical protein